MLSLQESPGYSASPQIDVALAFLRLGNPEVAGERPDGR
jgi:hypothetical protein